MKYTFQIASVLLLIHISSYSQNSSIVINSTLKVSDTQGNLTQNFNNNDQFGTDAELLSDINGDGVKDIALTASGDNSDREAVYLNLIHELIRRNNQLIAIASNPSKY